MKQENETAEANLEQGLAESRMPGHLKPGLLGYIRNGIIPGSFLQAILCNQLRQACAAADSDMNMVHMRAVTRWLQDYAPLESFGSLEKMNAWSAARMKERKRD